MDFWRFHIPDELGSPLPGSYDAPLVVLSVLIASLAALTALAVVDRIVVLRRRDENPHRVWLCIGALAMGSGIWAMHFTAMLAYSLPVRMAYSLPLTLLSMLPAMFGSWCALTVMSSEHVVWRRIQTGGLLMALGIGTMHYTGMEAMILDAHMVYDFRLFALSIIVAHILATVSLYVRFVTGKERRSGLGTRILSAGVMGTAVAGMHYTAMAAVRFYPSEHQNLQEMLLSPGPLGVLIAVIVILITGLTMLGATVDRRLTEASDSVLESATRYEGVLATMADGFAVLREDETVETFNAAAEKMFGVRSTDVEGRPFGALVVADENRTPLQHFRSTGDSYLMHYGRQIEGRRNDGRLFPVDLAISRMEIRGQDLYTCRMRDVSERRSLERQLSQAQKLESIGQLAAGIAHEINTPTQYVTDNTRFLKDAFEELLAPLKRLISLTHDEAPDGPAQLAEVAAALEQADVGYLTEEIPQAIDQCLDGLDRIAKIVRAMKEFSHPSAEKTPIDVNRAIESTVTVASNEWKYVANVETDFDPALPQVSCLPGDFNQAILNIVVNAAQAIGQAIDQTNGGDAEKGFIRISTRRAGDWVEIRIADNGPGIPEGVRRSVFDPFFTTKEVGKGTGQGLSIAHATIVNKHDGKLAVESEVGKGTCFIIRLPTDEHEATNTSLEVSA